MSELAIDKETAVSLIILSIVFADGDLDAAEIVKVEEILDRIEYNKKNFHRTSLYVSGLKRSEILELEKKGLEFAKGILSDEKKHFLLELLEEIAHSDGEFCHFEKAQMEKVKKELGLV